MYAAIHHRLLEPLLAAFTGRTLESSPDVEAAFGAPPPPSPGAMKCGMG